MKNKFLIITIMALSSLTGCSSKSVSNRPSGDIESGPDAQTYLAQYKGKPLKVGDKVRIMEYDFGGNLKRRQSRNMPFATTKKVIGEATVSSILNEHYYELKTDKPEHIPGDAFIEKL